MNALLYHGYVFTVLNIYGYPSRRPGPVTPAPASSASVMKKTYSTFRPNFLQHVGEHSVPSTEQLDSSPPLNQPGLGLLRIFMSFHFSLFFFIFCEFFISSSSSRPYQYITVVFRNSLPSATEDTQEPRISRQLTSC